MPVKRPCGRVPRPQLGVPYHSPFRITRPLRRASFPPVDSAPRPPALCPCPAPSPPSLAACHDTLALRQGLQDRGAAAVRHDQEERDHHGGLGLDRVHPLRRAAARRRRLGSALSVGGTSTPLVLTHRCLMGGALYITMSKTGGVGYEGIDIDISDHLGGISELCTTPLRAVRCALLWAHAHGMRIVACDPML